MHLTHRPDVTNNNPGIRDEMRIPGLLVCRTMTVTLVLTGMTRYSGVSEDGFS